MSSDRPTLPTEQTIVVDDWPMSLETTRTELQKARRRLERYQAVLRLANTEIEQRNRHIIALTTFTHQASRSLRVNTLLKLILVQALDTIAAPVGAVILFEPESKALSLVVHRGLSPHLIKILTGQEINRGATALMPHLVSGEGALLEYENSDDSNERLLLTSGRLSSLVSLPLHVDARLVGTLVVGLQDKKLFRSSQLWFLVSLTQQAAVILDNLRLRDELWHTAETFLGEQITEIGGAESDLAEISLDISPSLGLVNSPPPPPQPAEDDLELLLAAMMEAEDEVQQHNTDLQTLNGLSEMLNQTLDLKEILQRTVDQTRHILQTDAAWIYLIDEKKGLELRAHTGLSEVYVRGMQCLSPGDGPEGQAVLENKAVFIEALSTDSRPCKIWVDKEGLEALAAVPLTTPKLAGGATSPVIGVLVAGKRPGVGTGQSFAPTWTPREGRLLTSIANQVGLAINNACLYAQVQDKEISVRTGNEVLRTINDMLLEKNAFLEGLLADELAPDLEQAVALFRRFLKTVDPTLAKVHRPELAALQQIISRLNRQVRETHTLNVALDTELRSSLPQDETIAEYTGSSTPLRLDRVHKS